MAGLNTKFLILYDRWPGYPDPNCQVPAGGFANTTDNCVTTPTYPIGCKIQTYNDATDSPGYYTMQYLAFCEGTKADASGYETTDISTGQKCCFHADLSQSADGTEAMWYTTTNDLTQSDGTNGGPIAFAAADLGCGITVADLVWGFFWVGGVCPCNTANSDMTNLGAVWKTDADVSQGSEVFVQDDGTGMASVHQYDLTFVCDDTVETINSAPIGWAVVDDT